MDRQTQHSKKLLLGIVLQGNLTTWVKWTIASLALWGWN
jgi:hypothetical protein